MQFLDTPNIPDIWPIASVSECPGITLRQWQIFEVQLPQKPNRTRHFVGYSVHDRAGQVSSAIKQFDQTTMRGVTESGRVYQLLGLPGWNADADHTWRRWKSICSITSELDVTGSVQLTGINEQ
jgi:hypothetical protein